ncbi:hypothetical protein PN466_17310 [Roseofilum reptotaenium CS-1145]|uniref:WD40 domain-containing protein n=1 Tax=Roseofilum reptotaenium TaxID=1233427 RepID=UPI000AA44DD7|nr:NB-ARC domain-containing protein [Roseofilum reptotaenium]MDB9518707.1 hypothetical protein [Roseofilum reptotaenium CS-1145]
MGNRKTAKASPEGLEKIKRAIAKIEREQQANLKGEDWADRANQFLPSETIKHGGKETEIPTSISVSTWHRFRRGKQKIVLEIFQALCQMLGLEWQGIVDDPSNELGGIDPDANSPYQDWGDAPEITHFFGREDELSTLIKWIVDEQCRLVGIVGLAGVGKTGLSLQFNKGGIGKTDLSLTLVDRIKDRFKYIIWRKLLNAPRLDDLLDDIIHFFDKQSETLFSQRTDEKILWLLNHLDRHKCLIILDNVETILQEGGMAGQYREGYHNYGQFFEQLGRVRHQSCVLFTSREVPKTIQNLSGDKKLVRLLKLEGVDTQAGKNIFKTISTDFEATDEQWNKLIQWYNGNPLTLELVSQHIKQVYQGDIAEFLKEGRPILGEPLNESENERDDLRKLLDWYFQRFSEREQEVMYWLAINRQPVSIAELKEDLISTSAQKQLTETLYSLELRLPLERGSYKNTFTLQPMLIEYWTERFIEGICDEVNTGDIQLLNSHALLKVFGKDYIKASQKRTIINPIKENLLDRLGSRYQLIQKLNNLIVREKDLRRDFGYFAGNMINLLCSLEVDLKGYDFSGLSILQADLQGVELPDVDFSNCHFKRSSFTQELGGVHAATFSPDGKFLALGDSKCQIRIFTAHDRNLIKTFQSKGWWITSLSFSPCCQKIVSSSYGSSVLQLWDISTGEVWNLEGHTELIWTAVFHPCRSIIASGSDDKTIRIWDATTQKCLQVLEGHQEWVLSVAFSGDGQVFASASKDATIKLWDIDRGQCLKTLTEHKEGIWSVFLSPDGKIMASSGFEPEVKLWNVSTVDCTHTLKGHTKAIKALAISPDGKIVASGGFDNVIRLWEIQTGECLKILSGHTAPIRTIAFNPDSTLLVSGDNEQTVKFWDIQSRECLQTWQGYVNWIWSIAISPDGKYIGSGHLDRQVRIWEIETGNCVKTLPGHTAWIWAVAFSPDGKWLASSSEDETIRIYDAQTGRLWTTLVPNTDEFHGIVGAIAWSPDRQLMACSYQAKQIKVWNFSTKQWTALPGEVTWSWSLAFNPAVPFQNYPILAGADHDGTIKLWDIQTLSQIRTLNGHESKVEAIAFSPDGECLVSGSDDCTIKVWRVSTGECIQTMDEQTEGVWSVASSPNGQILASGYLPGDRGAKIKLWDVQTGQCLYTLQGHKHTVRSLAFTPDSQTLVSGSADCTIRSWNVHTGECLKILTIPRPYEGMNITGIGGLTELQIQALMSLGAKQD